jgi:PAS domain S-box-containing protein
MTKPLRALIVEDRVSDATLVVRELERAGFAPTWKCVDTEEQYVSQLETLPELILADYNMPKFGAVRALEVLQETGLDIPFIIVSGSIGEEVAVEAMRQGAADYLLKDRLGRLGPAVTNALEQSRSRKEVKRAAAELLTTHEQLRHLLAHSPAVIYVLTLKDDHVAPTVVSDNIERLFGVTAEESTYEWWLESLHPDDRKRVLNTVGKSFSGDGYSMEYRIRHKDGGYHWVEDNSRVVRDGSGLATEAVGVWTDITERKQAEDATRESEERMRSVLESALDCVITMDHQGRVVEFNPAAERTFGYNREGAIGQLLADLIIPPASRERHQHGLARYLSTGEAVVLGKRIELTGMRSDKSEFPLELSITRMGSQEPPMFTGFIRDITERKQAENRLREQAKLLDLAQDAIMVRDMEDRVEFWNHGAEKLYGWTAAEVHCRQASSFLHEEPPSTALAAKMAVTESGKWSGECKHLRKDGDSVMVRSRWTLVRDELGVPQSILIINTDVTEQKKIEEQFLRAQRLESIGTLASGVAHDLNNILVPILMAAPLLRDDMPAAERDKLLAIVESSAERGASIVKQVLTFARGADGDRVLLQPIYLVQEIAKIAEKTFPKSMAVRTRYPEDLWTILADPTQLHQILLNLCINARDAMPAGGTLTLALENFDVDAHYANMMPGAKAGPHVLIEVSDTGTGIPHETIDKIFDPFFTTKELGKGTGLGLSTAIGIVKSHGGFMQVYSEVGRGTSFKVFLPANVTEGADAPTFETTPLPRAHGELLLIVDDEKSILQVAKAILEDQGYRVVTAADATEALAIFALRMNEVDLVLTDLAMPIMDGVALIRTLQKMKPDVRIVASTGRGAQDGRANEIASLNIRASLAKPYNKNKLLTVLHEALAQASDEPKEQARPHPRLADPFLPTCAPPPASAPFQTNNL